MLGASRIGMPIAKTSVCRYSRAVTYDQLIAYYGTQKAAGDALKVFDGVGVTQPSVAEWKEKGIPAPRQAQYELLTRGDLVADRVAEGELAISGAK